MFNQMRRCVAERAGAIPLLFVIKNTIACARSPDHVGVSFSRISHSLKFLSLCFTFLLPSSKVTSPAAPSSLLLTQHSPKPPRERLSLSDLEDEGREEKSEKVKEEGVEEEAEAVDVVIEIVCVCVRIVCGRQEDEDCG